MEHKNSFSLEESLQAYKQDCANRPGISLEDAKELENDLRERVADGVKAGLREEEAFLHAVREVGSPAELAREFARENPIAIWRERLLWIVWAGFATSVWGLLTNGTLSWFFRELGVLLPFSWAGWMSLTGQLPVLVVAALLATGRLEKQLASFNWLLRSRAWLATAAGTALVAGALVRLFGPSPMQLPSGGSAWTALFVLDFFSWPLTLLALGVALFQPRSMDKTASMPFEQTCTPESVWHERVFWMALAGLLAGFWQSASSFGITALFYTGNNERPYNLAPLILMCVDKLILLSPLLVLGLMHYRQLRAGQGFHTERPDRRGIMLILATVVCGWIGLYFWSSYLWMPRGLAWPWPNLLRWYLSNLQWLWPMSLAALVFWLAPKRQPTEERVMVSQV